MLTAVCAISPLPCSEPHGFHEDPVEVGPTGQFHPLHVGGQRFQLHPEPIAEEQQFAARLGRVAEKGDLAGSFRRQQSQGQQALLPEMEAEGAGNKDPVDFGGGYPPLVQEDIDPGPDGPFGQLHLTHILLAQGDRFGNAELRGAVLFLDPRAERCRQPFGGGELAGGADHPASDQFRHQVHEPAAADPGDCAVTDDLQRHRAGGGDPHLFDGPGGRPHAAGDVHPLKGRTGCRGGGGQEAVTGQDHLAVGADIDEQGGPGELVQFRRQDAGGDVGPHVGGDNRGEVDQPGDCNGQPQVRRRQVVPPGKGRGERIFAQRRGVNPGGQMEHAGVAAEDRLVNPGPTDPGGGGKPGNEPVEFGEQFALQLRQPAWCGAEPDPGEDILGVQTLGVERRSRGEFLPGPQVHQGNYQGGRADIDHHPAELRRGVPPLHGQEPLPGIYEGLVRFRVESFADPGGDRYGAAFLPRGNDLESALGPGRDVDRNLTPHLGMAGEKPAGRLPLRRELLARRNGHRGHLLRRHPDGAFAAVPGAVAGGLNEHPGEPGCGQNGGSRFDNDADLIRQKGDPAHGVAFTVSVRARMVSRLDAVLSPQAGEMILMPSRMSPCV